MILVVGATGCMGRETVKQLLAAGISVRAMTRTPEKAKDLMQLGAEVVQGDLIDPPSLALACKGMIGVVAAAHQLMGSGSYSSRAVDYVGHRTLITAARTAGVRHFVYASMLGIRPDSQAEFMRNKYATEQFLIASGMNYTILRGSAFMDWHAHNLLGKDILEKGKTTIMGKGENPMNFVAARDMAKYAVIALTNPSACNQIINVGGPENFTKNQVADMYIRLSGKPAQVNHMPPVMLKIMSVVMKPIKPALAGVIAMTYQMEKENQRFDPGETLKQFPVELVRLEDFIQEKIDELKR